MKKLFFFGAFLVPYLTFAQTTVPSYDLAAPAVITPPSANSAAIAKVADIPVSYYTGKPEVSFPIYAIRSGHLSVPITLSYDATGIRVEQDATLAGLGWSVDAGGVITRSIVGIPDETTTKGYAASANTLGFPDFNDLYNTNWFNKVNNCQKVKLATNYYELTPDVYYLNFNGNSAKMYQDWKGRFYISPYRAWKISGSIKTGFTIVTEDGTTYIFGVGESMSNDITTNGDDGSVFSGYTGWYLTKMIAPNNTDTISFQYVSQSIDQSPKIAPRSTYELLNSSNNYTCAGIPDFGQTLISTVVTQGASPILSNITFKNGRVDFQLVKDRLDIPAQYRLAAINVTDTVNGISSISQRTLFNYNNTARTLLLTSMENIAGRDTLRHRFEYNAIDQLPGQTSYAQDHWGYYNAATGTGNTSLIPVFKDGFTTYAGANRNADSAGTVVGVLKKITYPTGGSVTMDFEVNDYSYLEGRYVNQAGQMDESLVPDQVRVSTSLATGVGTNNADTVHFKVNVSQPDTLYWQIKAAIAGDATVDLFVKDSATGTYLFSTSSGASSGIQMAYLNLVPGKVYIAGAVKGPNSDYGYFYMTIFNKLSTPRPAVYKMIGGGLRIKRITTFDGLNHNNDVVQRFKYLENDSTSSGYMMSSPVYAAYTLKAVYCSPGSFPEKQGDLTYLNRYSNSLSSLGKTQGSPVGYSRVTVMSGENGENGRDEYYYTVKGINDGNNKYPYPPPTSRDDLRGLLTRHEVYGADGKLKASTQNNYLYNSDETDTTFKPNFRYFYGSKWSIKKSDNIGDAQGCPTGPGWAFNGVMYNIYQFWPVIGSTVETQYPTTATGDPVVATSTFTYDTTNCKVSSITKTSSDGATWRTTYTYPLNYKGTQIYDTLLARHILDPVIEEKTFKNGTLVTWQKTDYALFGNLVLPSVVNAAVNANPLEQRIKYLQYDGQGNLLDASKTDDTHTVYLYGYHNAFPVAQVTGSDYSHVAALVVNNTLQNPASDAALRTELNKIRTGLASQNVLVTTYTYAAGKGMTSMTDPRGMTTFFEYDSRNRLHIIKDQNQNILKLICYNYWGQPQNCITAFTNVAKSQSFTRNNCGSTAVGSAVTYSVPANKYSSYISQVDADSKAQADINANGQNYANANGTCTYYSAPQAGTFTRTDCGTNFIGGSVTVTIPAGTSTSIISQADADAKAAAILQSTGPTQANQQGTCNCDREGYKLINGQCEKGTKKNFDTSVGGGQCQFWYQYQFSTGLDPVKYNLHNGPC